MSLEVLNPSFFTTIQDSGRFGYSHIGVTNSGVMDEYAYNILNILLNNEQDTNVLEISFFNFEVMFLRPTKIALTGADAIIKLNNELIKPWRTHSVKSGDILKIGKFFSGSKLYLGVKGGFSIKKEFGSNSTTIKEKLGGINGEFLKTGDILNYKSYINYYDKRLKEKYIPKYSTELELRVVLSYQKDSFSKEEKDKFFSSEYIISNDFNRMACKLKGEKINSSLGGIISEGIVYGSIQIPKDGQPIILLKDRQTIGGYPKIGVVLDIDCFKLAQAKPNTKIKFKPISFESAIKKSKEFYSSFNFRKSLSKSSFES
ncbi:allophanate hydrolase [Malaciobacter pacificus]|uniref:Allophanate hydrolase, subunit 2 n=1 Tax=Malaciobacter pacificus TaxID=1080223 RepID=A0A5C2H551_9BACT|nr:biotin-dependent carboxyltransferase family protein [Malaciobacter pacificus]QEP34067.1 allophanate hydrolase, subunit 2 [Malaciobacter pacificus]GGD40176.1 allophanate hydrolase [Malaciobacter pacificus]